MSRIDRLLVVGWTVFLGALLLYDMGVVVV